MRVVNEANLINYTITSNARFSECIRIRSRSLLSNLRKLRSRADIPQRRRRPGPLEPLVVPEEEELAGVLRGLHTLLGTCSSLPLPLS